MHSILLHTGRVLRNVQVSSKKMICTKYISPTFPGVTWVELPEGDAEFDECRNLAYVQSWGFLVNKCRIPANSTDLVIQVFHTVQGPWAYEHQPQPLALKPPSCAVKYLSNDADEVSENRVHNWVREWVKLKIFFLKGAPNASVEWSSARSESCW